MVVRLRLQDRRAHKQPAVFVTNEVLDALHGPVVLPLCAQPPQGTVKRASLKSACEGGRCEPRRLEGAYEAR
jgi:hypothetical protein